MAIASLREYLDRHGVKYIVISHSPAYTARGIAALSHVPGGELAKTVIVKLDGELVMAVLPASLRVDLVLLKKVRNANTAELAAEGDFKERFEECELGAMPPFGNLYGVDVIADESLTHDQEIAFNACSHRELIRLAWADFEALAKPQIARFAARATVEVA